MEDFFSSTLAERAAQGLSSAACIALHIDATNVFFTRVDKKNFLITEFTGNPDLHFWIPEVTMRHFIAIGCSDGTSLGTMGVSIFEHIVSQDESRKVKFKVEANFLTLWSKGYFSVLKAGGPEVASFLTRWGLDSASKIGKLLNQMRR